MESSEARNKLLQSQLEAYERAQAAQAEAHRQQLQSQLEAVERASAQQLQSQLEAVERAKAQHLQTQLEAIQQARAEQSSEETGKKAGKSDAVVSGLESRADDVSLTPFGFSSLQALTSSSYGGIVDDGGSGVPTSTNQASNSYPQSVLGALQGLGLPRRDTSGIGELLRDTPLHERAPGLGIPPRDIPGIGEPLRDTRSTNRAEQRQPQAVNSGGENASNAPLLDMLSRSVQQLQSLQTQAMLKGSDSPSAQENVKPGSTTLPSLPAPKDESASLQFQDWIELVTIAMSDLSDNSSLWWAKLLESVEEAYSRFLAATPIERLSIKPAASGLATGKWTRVNARACSMLLMAVEEAIKQDLIARRISQDMVQCVYRLFIMYQPGGSSEKTHVLRQLQNPTQPTTLQECLSALRNWPRWLRRCRQVGMSEPDPTVLASNLTKITSPFFAQYPDTNFRTQLLRTTLRIEAAPTVGSVESYHSHLLAEVETLMSSGTAMRSKLSVNALDGAGNGSPSSSPGKSPKGEVTCKYFLKANGCRRGSKCPFSHDMSQLSRDLRSKKCLLCGSESHRKRDCPTLGEAGSKGSGKRDEGSVKGKPFSSPSSASSSLPVASAQAVSAIEDKPGDTEASMSIEGLIKMAQQIVQGQTSPTHQQTGGEEGSASLRVMSLLNPKMGHDGSYVEATALVDTGATHPLRKAASSSEWSAANRVTVNLAGNKQVEMRITPTGTLLLPISESGSTTIVPVGELVQTLGYRLDWSRSRCRLVAPDGASMKLSMRDGCPQLPEYQALTLISRLEEKKLDELRSATKETERIVQSAAMSMTKSWFSSLVDFCSADVRSGYRALDESPFLKDVPDDAKSGLVTGNDLSNGWQVLKRMTCWNRAFRRRLLQSNSWIIHFFSGKGSNPAFKPLDAGDNVLLEIDLLNSSQMNVDSQALWDVIVWGCTHGKVSSILGGPPCRTFSRLRHRPPGPVPVRSRDHPFGWSDQSDAGRQEMIKDTRLFCRMIWAHALAVAGRVASSNKHGMVSSEVAFLLEQPADPQDYMDPNDPVYHEVPSFWATSLWELYSQEAGLMKVTFNQGAMGHVTPKPTSLGTNLVELCVLEGMKEEHKLPAYKGPSNELAIWSPGMCWAISLALRRWLCRPRMSALTRAQWQQHIKNHHTPYEKTCEVCVTSSGTGRRHVRVEHPESFVLSADVSGPLREGGLDTNGRGAHPKPHKYLLVATLRLPESYLQGYSSGKCDLTHSWNEAWVSTEPEPDDGLGLESESVPLNTGHLEDTEPEAISLQVHPSEGPLGDEVSGELHDMDRVTAEGALPLQHPLEALGFRDDGEGLVPAVEEEHRSVRGESVVDEADLLGADAHGVDGEEEQTSREERTDLSPPRMARMLFSIPIPDAKSATIKEALQDVLLYLRTHNVPVLRFHSDRASVFMARDTRQMLKGWGLRVTTSEGAVPQTNGVAEAGVKWVKQRIRALLIGSGLPLRLWPSAADTACILQRAALTGMASKLAAPFGSTVHVRKRPYTGVGTTAKPDSLRSQWIKGRYLGLSSTLSSGHVIYIPPEDGQPESFIHTFHVRCLTDPGFLEEEFHEHIPDPPLRRIRGKQPPPPGISSTQVTSSGSESINDLQCEAEEVLVHWNQDRALMLLDRASRSLDVTDFKVGAFRHGGVTGLLKDTEKYPWLSRLMVRCFTELDNEITFTAVYMSINTERDAHVDKNNQGGSMNYVIPVVSPKSGGGLWVELKDGDQVLGPVTTRTDSSGRQRFGTTRPLERGKVMQFDARRLHATEPWRGRRVVLIAYTPALAHKLDQQDITKMVRLGFPVDNDLSDSEDFDVKEASNEGSHLERAGGWSEVLPAGDTRYHFDVSWRIRQRPGSSMAMLHADAAGPEINLGAQERPGPSVAMFQVEEESCMIESEKRAMIPSSSGSDTRFGGSKNSDQGIGAVVDPGACITMCSGEVYLDLDGDGSSTNVAKLQLPEEELVKNVRPSMSKSEVGFTKNIEQVIAGLTEPLQVVHTVDPAEVLQHIHLWIPAIEKELGAVSHAVNKIPKDDPRQRDLLRATGVQRLPTKLVFTVKPGDAPRQDDPTTWVKRKVRLVVCGNLAAGTDADTYSGTAPAELVRAVLVLASGYKWIAGIVDIVSAFLRTPLVGDNAPKIIVQPPKVLERSALIPSGELWWLTHALYGLREAPRLWGQYRDDMLRPLKFSHEGMDYHIEQGRTESSWWAIKDKNGVVVGMMVIYVDDILICSEIVLVRALASAVSGIWRTTDLSLAVPGCPLRFLGIEIEVDNEGVFWVSQIGYIKEVLRAREVEPRSMDVIPVTKELSCLDLQTDPDAHTPDLVRCAQGITGEVLWLAQRTRPDLSFTASAMATLCSRNPGKAIELGTKVMRYLNQTVEYRLRMAASEQSLAMVSDSSFSPDGERSHTGWVILMNGAPILWRSGRQTIMSLSTAEAELNAMLEGGVALLSTKALLMDMGIYFTEKSLISDSTSALSISEGSCSWRTRHLRIRAQWLHEHISTGSIKVVHCPGERLVADLLTKPLSSARLRALLRLWGMDLGDATEESAAAAASFSNAQTATPPARVTPNNPPIARALVALLALMQVRESQGMDLVPNYEELAPRGLAVDRTLLTTTWLMVAVLVCVVAWEVVKWMVVTTTKKARRLARLRVQAADAVQRELQRHAESADRLNESDAVTDRPAPNSRGSRVNSRARREHQRQNDVWTGQVRDSQARGSRDPHSQHPLEETFVRGLYTRSERGRLVDCGSQTDPWEPAPIIREVRVEIPIETPSRESSLLGDFEPIPGNVMVSQFGEHFHSTAQCEGLRKARTQVRPVAPCLACLGNVQLFKRRRNFRRLTPSHTG